MALKRFAALDVGSFETELGIYEADQRRGLRRIDSLRKQLPLGSDTFRSGLITREHGEELLSILEDFSERIREYRCAHVSAVGTSALREAENAPLLLDRIRVRTGLEVQVISNAELRLLSCKALAASGDRFEELIREGTAIADLGYGSMQITLYDQGQMVGTQNLSLGALRIRETLGQLNTAGDERERILSELVDHELDLYRRLHLGDRKIRNVICIGDLIRVLYERLLRRVYGAEAKDRMATRKQLVRGYEAILGRADMELEDLLGVNSNTASLMVPAAIIYRRVAEFLQAERLWFPGIRLIDGIAADYAFSRKMIRDSHDFSADVLSAVREIARRYGEDTPHRQYAVENACRIFDLLKKNQNFSDRDRLLLTIAAMLHHCGRFINMGRAGSSGYDIVRATEIIGLPAEENRLVCDVLRCGDGRPDLREVPMKAVKFAAIIRLSDALDRSAKQKGGLFRMQVTEDDELLISTKSTEDMTLERLSFEQNTELFLEMFGLMPVFRQKRPF